MIYQFLSEKINEIIKDLGYNITVIKSNRPDISDYQIDDCFKLAKKYKENPMVIGNKIVDLINNYRLFSSYFTSVTLQKPGFINITISPKLINERLSLMITCEKFGISKPNSDDLYFIDYGGPNVAKPLHVGHMRTAIVGEAIKRIINYYGYKTISDVHLGDYGLQIGEVIYAAINENIDISQIDINYLDKTYPMMNQKCKSDSQLKEKCALITKKLQEGNLLYQKYFKKIVEVSVKDIKKIYNYLGVSFDLWLGESDSYKDISILEKKLKEKGLLEDSLGAKVIDVSLESDVKEIPPMIFQKSNGAYLYSTTDLATIYSRVKNYHPNYILYVVDNRQSLHFTQVFRAAKKLGIGCYLEHLGYGTVNGKDNKPYKTRNGNTPKLSELFSETKKIFVSKKESNHLMSENDLDIIVNSILKFADLQNSREKDYIFDINKFSETNGKTGPYVLYTYLRIDKILKNYKYSFHNFKNNIYNNYDRDLRIKLLDLDSALNSAFINRKPNYLVDYIYELCVLVNTFYQNNHIADIVDEDKLNDWLCVLSLSNKVIKEMINLLGIDIPTKM